MKDKQSEQRAEIERAGWCFRWDTFDKQEYSVWGRDLSRDTKQHISSLFELAPQHSSSTDKVLCWQAYYYQSWAPAAHIVDVLFREILVFIMVKMWQGEIWTEMIWIIWLKSLNTTKFSAGPKTTNLRNQKHQQAKGLNQNRSILIFRKRKKWGGWMVNVCTKARTWKRIYPESLLMLGLIAWTSTKNSCRIMFKSHPQPLPVSTILGRSCQISEMLIKQNGPDKVHEGTQWRNCRMESSLWLYQIGVVLTAEVMSVRKLEEHLPWWGSEHEANPTPLKVFPPGGPMIRSGYDILCYCMEITHNMNNVKKIVLQY